MNFRGQWNTLAPARKKLAVLLLIAGVVILVGVFGYQMKEQPVEKREAAKKKDITRLEKGLLEKSLYKEAQKEIEARDKKITDIARKQDNLESLIKQIVSEKNEAIQKERKGKEISAPDLPPVPKPPPPVRVNVPPVPQPGPQVSRLMNKEKTPPEPLFVGDIEIVSADVKDIETQDDIKKNVKRLYLPPSFMEATLLSGLDAPTMEGAQRNPTPALFRIKKLAILPNRVRANLKGCFVLAEGYGNLASERVELRLLSLSCIDKKGNSVIDQNVKGYVVDEDGKVGLSGHLVAKFGSMVARSMLAGFIGGIGSGVQQGFQGITVTPLGYADTADTAEDIAGAGIGGGIARASREMETFYLNLAKQTLPVIEVGATKVVTLVISEGVELEIQNDFCFEEDTC
jgi:conjugal transfer pilus assembly protein TraB